MYHKNDIYFGPAKAANAGGVAVSGLEMCQNSMRLLWSREEVEEKLKGIMKDIFDNAQAVRPLRGSPGLWLMLSDCVTKKGTALLMLYGTTITLLWVCSNFA